MKYPRCPEQIDDRKKLMKADIKRIRKLRKSGASRSELAKQYGVSETTIRFWCLSPERMIQERLLQRNRHKRWLKRNPEWRGKIDKASIQSKLKIRKEFPERHRFDNETSLRIYLKHRWYLLPRRRLRYRNRKKAELLEEIKVIPSELTAT